MTYLPRYELSRTSRSGYSVLATSCVKTRPRKMAIFEYFNFSRKTPVHRFLRTVQLQPHVFVSTVFYPPFISKQVPLAVGVAVPRTQPKNCGPRRAKAEGTEGALAFFGEKCKRRLQSYVRCVTPRRGTSPIGPIGRKRKGVIM